MQKKDLCMVDEKSAKFKFFMEESRYKQDCRKRAMDLAMQYITQWGDDPVLKYADKEKTVAPDIIELADKYYNWLISIPEK